MTADDVPFSDLTGTSPQPGRQADERTGHPAPPTGEPAVDSGDETPVDARSAHVWVSTKPFSPPPPGEPSRLRLELRLLPDGTPALPVFTSVELLRERMGRYQPNARIAVLELLTVVAREQIQVAIDPALTSTAPHWTADDLTAWNGE